MAARLFITTLGGDILSESPIELGERFVLATTCRWQREEEFDHVVVLSHGSLERP